MQYRKENDARLAVSEHSNWSFAAPPSLYRQAAEGDRLFLPGSSSFGAIHNVRNNASSSKHPPPFLTVVLMKLTKVLPEYCHHLGKPSYTSASLACKVLDCVVATASSPSHSPKIGKESNHRPSSPLSLKYWMSSSSADNKQQSPTSSAMALEGEWEMFESPFLLLAGAEVLSAGLDHLRPSSAVNNKNVNCTVVSTAASLTGLYQRVNQDLLRTKEVLCEPFLRPYLAHESPPVASLQHHHAKAAACLSSAIEMLVLATNVRCQLIDLQAGLFGIIDASTTVVSASDSDPETTPTLSEAAAAVTLFLQNIVTATSAARVEAKTEGDKSSSEGTKETPEPCSSVEPIISNMIQELKAWKYCFETCAALERCQ